jgi:hypothetical protein
MRDDDIDDLPSLEGRAQHPRRVLDLRELRHADDLLLS